MRKLDKLLGVIGTPPGVGEHRFWRRDLSKSWWLKVWLRWQIGEVCGLFAQFQTNSDKFEIIQTKSEKFWKKIWKILKKSSEVFWQIRTNLIVFVRIWSNNFFQIGHQVWETVTVAEESLFSEKLNRINSFETAGIWFDKCIWIGRRL